ICSGIPELYNILVLWDLQYQDIHNAYGSTFCRGEMIILSNWSLAVAAVIWLSFMDFVIIVWAFLIEVLEAMFTNKVPIFLDK
ncbi:659_t:CDS:2, partial [Ambispora leptoticha]